MFFRLFFSTLLTLSPGMLPAADTPDPNTPQLADKALFRSQEVLELSLTVDFDALCRPNQVDDCAYSPAALQLETAAGERSIPVQIQVRGGWRARKSHCEVPPLFVRFSAEGTADTPFAGQDLLPLTTHCKAKKGPALGGMPAADYEQYVLREFLGYRLYNQVTDRSLRVRLARITYTDPEQSGLSTTRYAFFTEHFDEMAARLGAVRLESGTFDHEKIDPFSLDQVALFGFMIGNTDWSAVRQRNIVLIADAQGRQYPVPFDLDMSGLVDAEYGGVSPRLDFRDPRHRYYLGFCHPRPDYQTLFATFREKKSELLALVKDIPGVSRSTRKSSLRYLDKFFDILESPEDSREDITAACHPWPPSPVDHTTPPDSA